MTIMAISKLPGGGRIALPLQAMLAAHLAGAAQAASAAAPATLPPVVVTGSLPEGLQNYRAEASETATLTDTPLRDIPQTINVIGREEIRDRQAREVGQVLEGVPNVVKAGSSANRSENFILRGFRAVGYAVDGMPLNAVADRPEVMLDLAGVQTVEVLKGPASVLYGAAEPGGIINIVTRPAQAEPGFEGSLSYGGFGARRAEASATGALTADGRLRARLTGAAQKEDGWVPGRPGSERRYVGGTLAWDPSVDTRLRFTLEHTASEQPFDRGLVIVPGTGEVLRPYDSWLAEPWSRVAGRKTRALLRVENTVSDALTLRASIGVDAGRVRDTGIDFQGFRSDGRTLRRRYSDRSEDTDTRDVRLEALWHFETGRVEHRLLTGIQQVRSRMLFERARANIADIDIHDPVQGAPRRPATINSSYDERVHTRAAYAQDQIALSERWKALAGVRWDEYRSRRDATVGDSVDPRTDHALTGRLGLVWQPRTDLALYGSGSQSFRPQRGYDRSGASLAPEKGTQYELGVRWDVIPDRLSANLAVFQITKKNVAVSDPADPGADYRLLTGEQRSRGAELDLAGEILPGWKVHLGVGYVDATVTRDTTGLAGNRLAGVPSVSAWFWSTYTVRTGAARGLSLGGGITHVGSRQGDLGNTFKVAAYQRVDAMVRYALGHGVEVSLAVKNVFDKAYIVSTQSAREVLAGAPRSVQLSLSWTY